MKRMDVILIGIILFVAAALFFSGILRPKEDGEMAIIYVDKKEYQQIFLNQDEEVVIENGNKRNIIKVKNGMVFMEEASCPDKVCIKQGKISKKNETIVCLPNKVVVEILNAEGDLDAVAK